MIKIKFCEYSLILNTNGALVCFVYFTFKYWTRLKMLDAHLLCPKRDFFLKFKNQPVTSTLKVFMAVFIALS